MLRQVEDSASNILQGLIRSVANVKSSVILWCLRPWSLVKINFHRKILVSKLAEGRNILGDSNNPLGHVGVR